MVRSLPLLSAYDGQLYESLAVAVLRVYFGGAGDPACGRRAWTFGGVARAGAAIPIAPDLTALVPFAGAAGPAAKRFRYISASDVLEGRVDPDVFKDRIVLVGASAQGIGDRQATAVNRSTPGVEIHATLIAGALAGESAVDALAWSRSAWRC